MRVTFLGTAAAEGYPNPFCGCENCRAARRAGGRSLRKRAAALINDDLLLDLGPDLISASFLHGCSLDALRYCLQTHAHADHLDTSFFLTRTREYGVSNAPRLHFYASTQSTQRALQELDPDLGAAGKLDSRSEERLNLQMHKIEPFQTFAAGAYRVTALPANHDPPVGALLYAVEAEGRRVFYGTDTGPLLDETWQALRRSGLRFDVIILDHTYGDEEGTGDHLNARQFSEHVARMRDEGLIAPDGRVLAHHIAHSSNPVHAEFTERARQHRYEVAYDGLIV